MAEEQGRFLLQDIFWPAGLTGFPPEFWGEVAQLLFAKADAEAGNI